MHLFFQKLLSCMSAAQKAKKYAPPMGSRILVEGHSVSGAFPHQSQHWHPPKPNHHAYVCFHIYILHGDSPRLEHKLAFVSSLCHVPISRRHSLDKTLGHEITHYKATLLAGPHLFEGAFAAVIKGLSITIANTTKTINTFTAHGHNVARTSATITNWKHGEHNKDTCIWGRVCGVYYQKSLSTWG